LPKLKCPVLIVLTFSAFGIGAHYLTSMDMMVITGGHIRVGLEENIYLSKGVLAKANVDFAKKTNIIIHEYGREIATPAEARKILILRN
jgi:3-keto-5-aminohexanoate cleavage enzyme